MMICINRTETDPYFNIAAEEYILKNYSENVMMVWQNQPSVIIGKHQNALSEVNFEYVENQKIPFIRRISGGGTVYHDLNNINYTLIKTEQRKDRLINFQDFLNPIIGYLSILGIKAFYTGKNNLNIGDKKISGNSAHVYKNRVLHHGTLLFKTDLDVLEKAIKPTGLHLEDKAVQSIRKTVTNINDHLQAKLTVFDFKEELTQYLLDFHKIDKIINLSDADHHAIQMLIKDRYKQWDWNYGYSPKFTLHTESANDQATIEVKNGIIINACFNSTYADHHQLEKLLTGVAHKKDTILKLLAERVIDENKVMEYARLLGF